MTPLCVSEVEFHPLSFVESSVRLFSWHGSLYRGVGAERSALYRRLVAERFVHEWVERGWLIETEIAEVQLEGYGLVLHHRRIPFVSYPYEWCAEMLKAAALLVLDFEIELSRHDLVLSDAHPWNVLFEGVRPVFVDFGSIAPADGTGRWAASDEFCRFFLNPLRLFAQGRTRIVRWLLHDYDSGVLWSDLHALGHRQLGMQLREASRALYTHAKQWVPASVRPLVKPVVDRMKAQFPAGAQGLRLTALSRVREEVAAMAFPPQRTVWTEYYKGAFPPLVPSPDWTTKHHNVLRVLSELRPASVLDVAANRGWYAQLAAELGSEVVAFDVDEPCVNQLFLDAHRAKRSILPLVMDFRNPSPGYGLCHQWFAPATQRLRCDMVMALAITHHLVFKQHLTFEQIVQGLAMLTTRWLLVEFIPAEDQYVREWGSVRNAWYTLEGFKAALERTFRHVNLYLSAPEPRVLLLCEKRAP